MRRFLVFLCAVLLIFGAVAEAQAAIVVFSLGDLLDPAQNISFEVGDKRFADWRLIGLSFSDVEPDLDLIEVIPLDDQPFNPGLQFIASDQLKVELDNFIALEFGFSVSTLSGEPLIKDNSLEIPEDGFTFEGLAGSISIEEDLFDFNPEGMPPPDNPDGFPFDTKLVFVDNPNPSPEDLFDDVDFIPQAQIFVEKFITVIGDPSGGVFSLDVFTQRFSQVQVPEPATLLLLATGLAGLAGLRRKFKR